MEYRLPAGNSTLYRRLHHFRTELILYMMAITRRYAVKKSISRYYTQLKDVQPFIGGRELLAAGLKPGPAFGRILDALLDAKLNGEIETRQDELAYVHRWIRRHASHNLLDSKTANQ
jgi:tRNA nucleotidyltransferase (CCA-adding enzyme)